MGKKNDLSDVVLNDFKKKYNKAVKEFAQEIAHEIERAYESVIDMFYEDYDPLYYRRTYSTYLASTGYNHLYEPWNFQHIGDSYFVGINVDGSNIPGNPYRAYKHWVFDRTFYKGIHGINRNDLIKMNKKRGGRYITANGVVKSINVYENTILMADNRVLEVKNILDIDGELFVNF